MKKSTLIHAGSLLPGNIQKPATVSKEETTETGSVILKIILLIVYVSLLFYSVKLFVM